MKNEKTKRLLSVLLNLVIVIWTIQSVLQFFVSESTQTMFNIRETTCFRYFTVDSNVLCALCSLAVLIAQLRGLKTGKPLPQSVLLLKFAGTAAVALTFLTVVLFLGPTQGYASMFSGNCFYLHLVGPLLAMVSLFLLEKGEEPVRFLQSLTAFVPFAVYGAVYLTMVIFIGEENGGWPDFYGFRLGGQWVISLAVMTAADFALCMLCRFLHNRAQWGGRKVKC